MKDRVQANLRSVVVFDWDGTLFDSAQQKLSNFTSVAMDVLCRRNVNVDSAKIESVVSTLTGRPRSEIFRGLFEKFGIELMDEEYDRISDQLSKLNEALLQSTKIFPDAARAVRRLGSLGTKLCISSSAPQSEVRKAFQTSMPAGLQPFFSHILGTTLSTTKGITHFEKITRDLKVSTVDITFVGDDLFDLEIAHRCNVHGVLVDRDARFTPTNGTHVLASLDELWTNNQ